jgi:hypothetical protein
MSELAVKLEFLFYLKPKIMAQFIASPRLC